MKRVFWLSLSLGLICFGFGYWGYFTENGNRYFDEMSGMIPFFALVAGAVFILLSAFAFLFGRRR